MYSVCGTRFVHISELIISKILEYSNLRNPLDIMNQLLKISHMAPISPDILPAVPFQNTDPFVIQQLPGKL